MRSLQAGIAAAALTGLSIARPPAALAQPAAPAPSVVLRLHQLHQEAVAMDARARELALLQEQTDLRLRNISTEWLPTVSALANAQYQSDVPTSPITGPAGQPAFASPKDTYDASLRMDQRLFDPTIQPREALARAELAESRARLRVALFGLRAQVNEAFFAAALLEQEMRALEVTMAELEGRLKETSAGVAAGAALPSDSAMIEATLLQNRQQLAALGANRRAALGRLASLTHRTIDTSVTLALPDLGAAVRKAQDGMAALRARPEFEQFTRTSERVLRQQELTAADDKPRVSAFGRVGYGQPGLNFINDGFDTYALAGVQVQWKAWNWGSTDRERRAQMLQRDILSAEETSFAESLKRTAETEFTAIEQLREVLDLDERIVPLRRSVERTARLRFQEGVITASEYLDRNTDWLNAEIAQSRHRVELAQAAARLLTTLGLEAE